LYGVPVVATANRTTANLDYLTENDFLGNPGNRVVVNFPLPAPGEALVTVTLVSGRPEK